MKKRTWKSARVVSACVTAVVPVAAQAHHAMDYATPGTPFEGLISGLAHPVIGLDHFLFVIAVGVAAYHFGRRAGTVLAFLGGTLGGTILHLQEATLPYPDVWVASSLVLLGFLFFRGRDFLQSDAGFFVFALSGIVHGYAYAETIVGAEPTPIIAYLVGFTLVQLAIASGTFALARYASERNLKVVPSTAAVGAALSLAGVTFLLLALV